MYSYRAASRADRGVGSRASSSTTSKASGEQFKSRAFKISNYHLVKPVAM